MLNEEQRKTLLRIAREAVEAATRGERYTSEADDPEFDNLGAAFVTLKKRGELRGCIGTIEAREPMLINVVRMARAAALDDPRFPAVQPAEVPDLTIDISLLSPAEKVTDVNEIEVGKHGLIIEQGSNRGLLLPQVPSEWGWDREEFLDHTCRKAGLPKGSWRKGDCTLYAFTAEVFGEEDEPSP
ncbi:MAG TPA: AmmeMemoRadiSam system protein A [Armatimonadota bacterium]|nr:AmmeMemoRadiSam system protein A [Armatimonadota bacterium]